SISMLSVLGLMLLIGWKGLTYFWPAPLYQWHVDSKERSLVVDLDKMVSKQDVLVGQLYERKYIPIEQVPQVHDLLSPQNLSMGLIQRLSIKVGNRELYPADFVSILDINLREPTTPPEWAVIERSRGGDFFGKPVGFKTASGTFYSNIDQKLEDGLLFADSLREETSRVVNQEISNVSWQLENLRLEKRKLELNESVSDDYL
ncbi:phosphate ABC transporter, permease protein PstA, partial [Vibrio sp. 10N.222.55.E8]